MKVTVKFRDQIVFALPELTLADAERIASLEGVGIATIYRAWKRLREFKAGDELEINTILISISELAASRKKIAEKNHKRLLQSQKQLSAA